MGTKATKTYPENDSNNKRILLTETLSNLKQIFEKLSISFPC